MECLEKYKSLRLKLTHIPQGEKGPGHPNWQHNPTPYKKLLNGLAKHNIGLLHGLSRTCCLDIDDLETALKVPGMKELIDGGVRYTSGKDNRVKVLYRIPKKYDINIFTTNTLKFEGKVIGQFRCVSDHGTSMQDVLPPSKHPDGYQYHWIDKIPLSRKEIPTLPKELIRQAQKQYHARKLNDERYKSENFAFYVRVYNDWFYDKGYSLEDEIMKTGGYEDIGMGRFHRKGSSNRLAIMLYHDEHGTFGINYSDTEGPDFIKSGAFDPYDMLVHNKFQGNEKKARKWVCTHSEMKRQVDAMNDHQAFNVGVDFKIDRTTKAPHLPIEIMMPKDSNFKKVVKAILHGQTAVYNPDMAFYLSLILIDYLAGGGYASVHSNNSEGLFAFTAGDSGDGKTQSINSFMSIVRQVFKYFKKKKTFEVQDFNNKEIITKIATSEGLQDKILALGSGCDIFLCSDEYGLSEKGTNSDKGRSMRGELLELRTIGRNKSYTRRLKAINKPSDARLISVSAVHFNYFTTATIESLKGVISDQDMGQGFLQRFVGGIARTEYFGSRNKILGNSVGDSKAPKKVIKLLAKIVLNSNNFRGTNREYNDDCHPVGLDDEAREFVNNLTDEYIESTDPNTNKVVQNLLPIARARAIIENPDKPTLTLQHVEWAHLIVYVSVKFFDYLLGRLKTSNKNPKMIVEDRIRKFMTKNCLADEQAVGSNNDLFIPVEQHKAMSRADILRFSNVSAGKDRYNANTYSPVWEILLNNKEILEVETKKDNGRIAKCYLLDPQYKFEDDDL